jgi:hypothetical protein
MVKPLLGEFETVFGLDFVFGGSVIQPHSLVGLGESGKYEGKGKQY